MQPRIGRHGAHSSRPATEHQLDEFAAIFQRQQHPVAGREAIGPEPAGDPGDAPRQLAVIPGVMVVADRGLLGQPTRDIEQQCREVHRYSRTVIARRLQ